MAKIARLTLLTGLVLILLILLVVGGAVGLLATERGTRWAAAWAADRLEGAVRWQDIKGSLWNRLEISGLEIEQPAFTAVAGSAVLAWQPAALLQREIRVSALTLQDARIVVSDGEEEASSTGAFDPSDVRLPVSVSLRGVAFDRLTLVMPGEAERIVEHFALSASFSGDRLDVDSLALRVREGELTLSGSVALRSRMPVDLTLLADGLLPTTADPGTPRPAQRASARLAVDGTVDWHEDGVATQLDYRVSVEGVEGLVPDLPPRVAASGRLQGRQRGDGLDIESASLALEDAPTVVKLRGTVLGTTTSDPTVEVELDWTALRWPLASDAALYRSDSGQVSVAGRASDYGLAFSASATGADLPPSRWEGRARGDTRGLVIEGLRGELLDGWIEASGPVTFDPQPVWALRVTADGIDPAFFVPEMAGPVEAALSTRGGIDAQGVPSAEIRIDELRATAAGFPLALTGDLQLNGEELQIARLQLRSGSSELQAGGRLSARQLDLTWSLAIADAGVLAPGASGRVEGEGHVSGTPDAPRAVAVLTATGLGMDTLTADRVKLDLEAGLEEKAPLALALSVSGVSEEDEVVLDTLSVEVDGSIATHRVEIAMDAPAAGVRGELQGGLSLADPTWRGELLSLAAQSAMAGAWDLQQPSSLELAADQMRLAESCLHRRSGAGRVCLSGNRASSGAAGLVVGVSALPVEAFVADVTGNLSGDIRAAIDAHGVLAVDGGLELGAGVVRLPEGIEGEPLAHGGGHVALAVGDDGLRAEGDFAAPADGRIDLALRLPQLRALPLGTPQPLEGRVEASLPDLAIVAALVEALGASGGALNAKLELAGTLEAPLIDGELRLADGSATLPLAGLDLREIELRLAHGADDPELLTLTGGLRSGRGRFEVSGSVNPLDGAAEIRLRGEDVTAFDTADARVLVSPDLTINRSGDLLRVRGLVSVPRAEITPRLQLGAATTESSAIGSQPGVLVGPSSDVVILGAQAPPGDAAAEFEAPLRIDAEVGLVMGRDVTVNALGLVARLQGAIGFSLTPEQSDLIPTARGGIALVDGTFRSFGQDLDIETGRVVYTGDPVTEPEVFLRAVRWIDSDPAVSAVGVQVSGPGTSPELELFSRPPLDTAEIQSYLLTGTGTGENSSTVAIGTQLSERIYVGYGYNLLEQTSEFDALFSITPRFGLGADVGEADSNFNLIFTYEK